MATSAGEALVTWIVFILVFVLGVAFGWLVLSIWREESDDK